MNDTRPDTDRQHNRDRVVSLNAYRQRRPAQAGAKSRGVPPPPGPQLVMALRARAEASVASGTATQWQRDFLKELLRGVGRPTVMSILGAAWGLAEPAEISAAQAEAILLEAAAAALQEPARSRWLAVWAGTAAELDHGRAG